MKLQDILNVEGEASSEENYYISLQRMINAGQWSLQGSTGRAMMAAIENGRCALGTDPARDYWRNRIPSRDEVEPGTKGSLLYVEQQAGANWRAMIEGV